MSEERRYFCDRCKVEMPTATWGRRVFRTKLIGWTQDHGVELCDRCTESFDVWLAGGYSLRELFGKKPG